MSKALVLSVGTGTRPDTDITQPLIKAIKSNNPDFVGFVTTLESRKFADVIIRKLSLPYEKTRILGLPNPDDLNDIFQKSRDFISSFITEYSLSPSDLTIDYTSGTKSMTAAVSFAGISLTCGHLQYITGKRQNGVVMSGTEKITSFIPYSIIASFQINLAEKYITKLRFDAALQILNSLSPGCLSDSDSFLVKNMKLIAQAYQAWDLFNHNEFRKYYNEIKFNADNIKKFMISESCQNKLNDLISVTIPNTPDGIKQDHKWDYLITDLYNNASRRMMENKFDDAVARYYRLTELLAQSVLYKKYKIKTSKVPPQKLPDDLKRKEKNADGTVKLGLQDDYILLKCFENNKKEKGIGTYFSNKQSLKNLLGKRNTSILAHGNKPVSKSDACKTRDELRNLILIEMPGFEELCGELQFPWIKVSY